MTRRHARRVVVAGLVAALAWAAGTGCGPTEPELPGNVTVRAEPIPAPPRIPDELGPLAGRLAGLVDWHDADFSGSWYDPGSGQLCLGVATDPGRALLAAKGLAADPRVRVVPADRSLRAGQALAEEYARGSALWDRLVGYGALPEGDGISLEVTGVLTKAQLAELGDLPVRVVVTTGGGRGTVD